jgi:hypothetical protein
VVRSTFKSVAPEKDAKLVQYFGNVARQAAATKHGCHNFWGTASDSESGGAKTASLTASGGYSAFAPSVLRVCWKRGHEKIAGKLRATQKRTPEAEKRLAEFDIASDYRN